MGKLRVSFVETSQCGSFKEAANHLDESIVQLEAILFLSPHPLSSRKLAQLAGLADGTKARTLVRTLNRLYDSKGRAFRVEEVAGGFQLMTRPKFATWLRRMQSAPVEVRLSGPAMETLAVVAYRQPVLRADIEAIRGVQSGEVLRQLIERDLVRIMGRSDEPGRPFLYGTTKSFLQFFGLRHLDELPRADILRASSHSVILGYNESSGTPLENSNQINQPQVAEEETNVKTLITAKAAKQDSLAEDRIATVMEHPYSDRSSDIVARYEDEDVDDDDDDEDDDDDDDDDDLDDEWEEVDDDDLEEDEEEEDDEDWDDEDDEDWDDEDWDDDEEDDDDDDEDWDEDDDDEDGDGDDDDDAGDEE
jgi:segregation and condensation protein B